MANVKEKRSIATSPLEKIYPLVNKLSTGEQLILLQVVQKVLDDKADQAAKELDLIRPAIHSN
jgi:hypothetical protein